MKSVWLMAVVALACCAGAAGLEGARFGETKEGAAVTQYTLKNRCGMTAVLIDYGATLVRLEVPAPDGTVANVVLGCETVDCYETKSPYFGCIVGRYANRIGNGAFTLDGKAYSLAINNAPNSLHGGKRGFDKVIWAAADAPARPDAAGIVFTYTSVDGEEGYPGTVHTAVTYWLTDAGELTVDYTATTDKATPINLTHHSYFNLTGEGSGDVLGHEVEINASHYTPTDATLIPTGEVAPVAGTPLDFRKPHRIGERIGQVEGGYDHNFVLDGAPGWLRFAARAKDPKSGRQMEIYTTEPGIQYYTGNFLDGTIVGPGGGSYGKHAGFCLETQRFPDTPNKPSFPSCVLRPGEEYRHTTVHRFNVTGKTGGTR